MANLAFPWKSSGRDTEAINLLRNCKCKQEQRLGSFHPSTVYSSEILLEWESGVLDELSAAKLLDGLQHNRRLVRQAKGEYEVVGGGGKIEGGMVTVG